MEWVKVSEENRCTDGKLYKVLLKDYDYIGDTPVPRLALVVGQYDENSVSGKDYSCISVDPLEGMVNCFWAESSEIIAKEELTDEEWESIHFSINLIEL